MDHATLTALAEPNRLRIVELLDEAPRSVGEIAAVLGLRQPQATKHLQTLQRAGLVTMHPLGQRRIYALRREPLRELRTWLARFDGDRPDEHVLEQYRRAIDAELRNPERERTLSFERLLPAPPSAVWRAWTTPDGVRRWWAPRHFTVADCEVDATPGGALRIVMAEGDGTRHSAAGRFLDVRRPRTLRFELAPLDADGAQLFTAVHDVRLAPAGGGATKLAMTIDVTDARAEAAPALAGMEPGWSQLLDNLAEAVAR